MADMTIGFVGGGEGALKLLRHFRKLGFEVGGVMDIAPEAPAMAEAVLVSHRPAGPRPRPARGRPPHLQVR